MGGAVPMEYAMHTSFVMEIESISESIQNASQRMEFVLKHAQSAHTKSVIDGVVKVLGHANIYAWAMREGDDLRLQVTMNLHNLRGFKDRKLTKMFDHLMTQGFEPTRTKDFVSEDMISRDFVFAKDDITVRIHAYVRNDSKTCKRVQIGEEISVKPKFEIVCK